MTSLGAVTLAGSAYAADLAPPPPPAPAFTWTGLYVGAQVGYAWGRDNASWAGTDNNTLDVSSGAFGLSPNGVIGGLHVGYNYQFTPWLVVGLEGSVDGTSLSKTASVPVSDFAGGTFGSMTASSNEGVQGSVRGRVGIVWDRVMLYATGGVAVTSFNTTYIDSSGFFTGIPGSSATLSYTRAGYTLGGGVEYAFTNNWSLRAEYRYSNYGNVNDYPFANPNNNVLPTNGSFTVQHYPSVSQFQVGITYRFDWTVPPPTPPEAAPVVAKR